MMFDYMAAARRVGIPGDKLAIARAPRGSGPRRVPRRRDHADSRSGVDRAVHEFRRGR